MKLVLMTLCALAFFSGCGGEDDSDPDSDAGADADSDSDSDSDADADSDTDSDSDSDADSDTDSDTGSEIDCGGQCDDAQGRRVLVITSDFVTSVYGESFSQAPGCFGEAGPAEGDSIATVAGSTAIVIERSLGTLTLLDSDLAIVSNFSVADEDGPAPNPHDAVLESDTVGYVTRFGQSTLAVIDPSAGEVTGTIDLAELADEDGNPEMDALALTDDALLVSLELLDPGFQPTGNGRIAVIDREDHSIRGTIDLPAPNPNGRFRRHGGTGELLLALTGNFGEQDGGIVGLGAEADSAETIVTEEALGGDVNAFAIADTDHGWAVVSTEAFTTLLVPFDPEDGTTSAPLVSSEGFDLRDIELAEGVLLVADSAPDAPALRSFSIDGTEQSCPWSFDLPPTYVLAF